jgi:hypothetical protein
MLDDLIVIKKKQKKTKSFNYSIHKLLFNVLSLDFKSILFFFCFVFNLIKLIIYVHIYIYLLDI